MTRSKQEHTVDAFTWSVADFVWRLLIEASDMPHVPEMGRLSSFMVDAVPDLVLRAHYDYMPQRSWGTPLFDCGVWSLHRDEDHVFIRLPAVSWNAPPEYLAVVDRGFRGGDIYICPGKFWDSWFPLRKPLGEVLMLHLLSRDGGVLCHASGVMMDGNVLLFMGNSGAGKTTLSRLWLQMQNVTLLNDDRIVVREKHGQLWAYGTPWHGDEGTVSPANGPLKRVFIIHHARENTLTPLFGARAIAEMLPRVFPPYWDPAGMSATLELLERIVQTTPCYALGFTPDVSVTDFIRRSLVI